MPLNLYDLVTQSTQYWEWWHRPAPGRPGSRIEFKASLGNRVPGQPGPHETCLKNPNKLSPQDKESLWSTFSSDFIPLPRGRLLIRRTELSAQTHISTPTHGMRQLPDMKTSKPERPCTGTPTPTGPVRERCPLIHSLPHCLSSCHNRAKPQNNKKR